MINILKMSFKIDITYAINSFIYNIKRFPILKDLFPSDSLYKSTKIKSLIRILALILSTLKIIAFKLLYFCIIYLLASILTPNNISTGILHVYFVFTIFGILFNNKVLATSTKKYFSIILFNMDAKEFMKATLWTEALINLITHSIILLFLVHNPIIILFTILGFLGRFIGERLNLAHYNKYKISLTYNYPLYWTVLAICIGLILLPLINITVTPMIIGIINILFAVLAVKSYIGLTKINNYKLIYKRLNTKVAALNSNQAKDYSRQAMVEIKEKDKKIDERKLKGKNGYDLFNTIFFERHKEILLRSAKWFAMISLTVMIGLVILMTIIPNLSLRLNEFLRNNISWFVIVMYFINRGAIITQAMFYNCDHSMLSFNFYRNPKVILNVFKTRVLTVSKVNLLPASVIALGIPILLYLSGGTTNPLDYISIPIFIIALSIFFSIHYLVIYYLFQPYDKNMAMKSFTYSLISMATYLVAYSLTDFRMSTTAFSIIAIIATVIYCVVSLITVYKKAPSTFRIR